MLSANRSAAGKASLAYAMRSAQASTRLTSRCLSTSAPMMEKSEKTEKWRQPVSRPTAFPDFIHAWNRDKFRNISVLGLAGSAAAIAAFGVSAATVIPLGLMGMFYKIGTENIAQPHYAILRNYPVLGNFRYIFEIIRPEIRQYFIESDTEAVPYNRLERVMVYQRSKEMPDVQPFGTQFNVYQVGYEWANHSIWPQHIDESNARVTIGSAANGCEKPYSASLLNISGMSYGALSYNAVLALNEGARLANCYHNTGEGGMSQFHKAPGGDIVWNIGTGYFGCGSGGKKRVFEPELFKENANLPQCKMIELKLSQGAKPAHGGMLPVAKITKEIAIARNLQFPASEDCDSPARHSAFSTPHEMMEFIAKLREMSGGKPVGFKLCVGQPEEFSALCHAMIETGIRPDFITVDGGEGGTGAAPPEFSNHIGMPLQEGLTLVSNMLIGSNLREHIKIIASGKVASGFSVVRTIAMGADVCNAARAFMFSLGCIQALKCHTNECPTGVATQKESLIYGLDPSHKAIRVMNYHRATVRNALDLMGAIGVKHPRELHGHHIMRRVAPNKVRTLDELYPRIEPGCLLRGQGPSRLQEAWDLDDGIVQRSFIY